MRPFINTGSKPNKNGNGTLRTNMEKKGVLNGKKMKITMASLSEASPLDVL